MPYTVKDIFHSLQGEGVRAGRAAVFVRFAGCNLWSGREEDRSTAVCRFCDTDFLPQGARRFADADSLAQAAVALWRGEGRPYAVLSGGEPALQLDADLLAALKRQGFEVAVETNGTRALPSGLDWITVSPKAGAPLVVREGDELKLVFPQDGLSPESVTGLAFRHFVLQPLDGPERDVNTRLALGYCLAHPFWRLGLQIHKMLGIP